MRSSSVSISAAITIHALMTCARAPRPPPLRSCADEPPRVGPRHGDPAPSQVAEVPLAGFDSEFFQASRGEVGRSHG